MPRPPLDVIAIGRSSVDLYGAQVGGRLEDMASFSKAVGGCPTNIAIGGARLGLRTGLITRVGDEHMGRYIREQLRREGVDVAGVRTDPARLTALVLLGIRDDKTFPLIFYRENCADGALDEGDIDEDYVASARAIVVTGTHFATPKAAAAQRLAMRLARKHGRKVCFDIDYRPNLWGLAGHGAGEERYVRSDAVSAHLAPILPECDLIVGTEEELMIAGGASEPLAAIRAVRAMTKAVIVCKRGPMGCVVFDGAIPDDIEKGLKGPGFPVEVYNVLGAGDAFMAGFLRGWLRGEPIETCCAFANAGGAFAVSRLLCSAEYPTWEELQTFLGQTRRRRQLRFDAELAHVHHATTRRAAPADLTIFSIDHRPDHLGLAADDEAAMARLAAFKALAVEAAAGVAAGRPGFGMFLEGGAGREALFRAADHDFWIARQIGGDPALPDVASLDEWPATQVCKAMINGRSGAPPARQRAALKRLAGVCRARGRELLVEALPAGGEGVAALMAAIYDDGVMPDWWLIEPPADAPAWTTIGEMLRARDAHCRGVIVIARDLDDRAALRLARRSPHAARGVVAGRALFAAALDGFLSGALDARAAVAAMGANFSKLATAWSEAAPAGSKP